MAGRKRHLLVDTLGLIWGLAVLPAAPTDWDGAVKLFERFGQFLPRLAKVWADSNYRVEALLNWIKANPSGASRLTLIETGILADGGDRFWRSVQEAFAPV